MNSTATVQAKSPSATALQRFIVPVAALVTSFTFVVALWRSQGLVDNRPDPYWFSAMAESLLRGEGFKNFGSLLHRRTPGYPFFLAALYAIFGVKQYVVQVAQCFLFAGTAWLTQGIGRRLFSERVGLIAGLLCAVNITLLRYVPDLHLETLLAFFMTLSVLLSCRFVEQPSAGRGALLGLSWCVASIVKAVPLLYPPVFAVLWWYTRLRKTTNGLPGLARAAAPLAVAALTMALTIAPWTVRNYMATGHFVPITSGASDAVLRSYVFSRTEFITLQRPPYTDAENEVNAEFRALCAKQGAVWEADDYQTDRILNAAMKERLKQDPLGFVRKTLLGMFTFWYQMTSLKTSLVAGGLALLAWTLAFIGLPRAKREGRTIWLVLAPVVYLNVFLALLLSLGRYQVPVLPCLMVLSAFGVDTLLQRFRPAAA